MAVSLGVRRTGRFLQLVGLTLIVVIDPDPDFNYSESDGVRSMQGKVQGASDFPRPG